jgi:hypothetical protein
MMRSRHDRLGSADRVRSLSNDTQESDMEPGAKPRCQRIAMWSSTRCERPAMVRVFRSHGGGVTPVYTERCVMHAVSDLGPNLAAIWDEESRSWTAVGR